MRFRPAAAVVVAVALVVLAFVSRSAPAEVGPFPGVAWTDRQGEPVPTSVLALYADDCPGRESAAFLDVLWPLDPPPDATPEMRRYVRDPEFVMPTTRLLGPYDPASALPTGAQFSGYQAGDIQLWIGPDSDTFLYLVYGARTEALPRAVDEEVGCPTSS